MAINLRGRSFLTLMDFSPREIRYLLDLSHDLKQKKRMGLHGHLLSGKNIVLLFDKTSTRTRCAFEVATLEEGAHVTYLTNSQFQVKESLEDTAKVLGRFYDGIEYRGYEQAVVTELAKYAGIPVWNGLTDVDHPTQILADFLTLEEEIRGKQLSDMKLVFTGDTKNNMAYALMYGAAKMGMHFVALGPKERAPDEKVLQQVAAVSKITGAVIEFTDNVDHAVKGADAIYTDVWVSMGEKVDYAERAKLLQPFRVTMDMLNKTGNDHTLFMHCLPSYHDFETETARNFKEQGVDIREVEDAVFRHRNSVVFDQAENRMHTIKAVIVSTIG